jgi:transposase
VANPNHDAWRWKNVKNKSDRGDALKLAQLSAANQLPQVKVPSPAVRQWRNLIAYRHKLVRERTRVKNAIRAILHGQGLAQLPRKKGWTEVSIKYLVTLSASLERADGLKLWKGQLEIELKRLEQITTLIDQVTVKLDEIAKQDKRVEQLRSIPGVGPRLAEVVVATIDDPQRFKTSKQVGAYAGLTPRQFQSGTMDRKGRISCQGNPLLRALLVEVSWLGRQHNPWLKQLHDHVSHGSKTRRKIAIIAVARRLLVVCWAMLRDGTRWRQPELMAPATAVPA